MSPHDLPLLSQLTACAHEVEDPIETLYLNPLDFETEMDHPKYTLEFFMGLRLDELHLNMSPNIIYVRSSIKRLFEEKKLVLIPSDEIVDIIFQLHEDNLKCAMCDRTRCTDLLPPKEYEYRVRPIELDIPLTIISNDGTRRSYTPSPENMLHVRSNVHPYLATSHAAFVLDEAGLRRVPVKEVVHLCIRDSWFKVPSSFGQMINWQKFAHPLEQGDIVSQILKPKEEEEPIPDLTPDNSSSTSYSSLDTNAVLDPVHYIQNPGTKRWVKRINKYIDHDVRFVDDVLNEKQINSYRKEKSRPYEEVMRTDLSAIRFAPYLRPKRKMRAYDDIYVPL
ncbi:hypothetical protein VNI00_004270 [Paramarasmius palmivorus]|uniref:Uncharacterized protein n=1 Tax=Paramarasmius palmivorus TaxID=297713 RepID=A0AAW0DMD6_9AGAR